MFSLPSRALLRTMRPPTASTSIIPLASSSSLSPPLCRSASSTPKPKPTALKQSTQLLDERIPHPMISLVDPSTSSLLPPAKLSDILLQLDRTRFAILLVDAGKEVPVCRILDKKVEWEKKVARSPLRAATEEGAPPAPPTPQKAKAGGPPKEIHLTWGVTSHDLSHKLSRAREFLSKGSRVVIVLKDKKGVSRASAEVQGAVRRDVREALEAGEGGEGGKGKCRKEGGKGGEWRMEFERF